MSSGGAIAVGTTQHTPTLIRNVHMVFCPYSMRWPAPSELLMLQGFPVAEEAKVNNEVLSFDTELLTPRLHGDLLHAA